ncbi:glycogen debranching enzyme [Rhizobium cellulosilyticum]|uniref:Glycogen debranching enzyme n=1 Tax=Aliirhizobium cellulosilyticum TaxID=393664 RepID=A0A7W6V2S8_9HYPH|nr:amylo-alpha-1,6-glucosidase [Rhizobium cellulosilyticum]MBB4414287.1 glycogen debranching enzyme [Rhizobium cellulosilyticum]MBB4448903.1 glycogen debranching enzyme [Rhizobium cellulosilyticum]
MTMDSEASKNVAEEPDTARYDLVVETSLVGESLQNLKDGDSFAVLNSHGDIGSTNTAEGLFCRDTRFLSKLELRFQGRKLLLLNSSSHDDKAALSVDLTNPEIQDDLGTLPRETIFLQRTKFLFKGVFYERLSIRNFTTFDRKLTIDYRFGADFRDLFEVRGINREKRGRETSRISAPDRVEFLYMGLDDVERQTSIAFAPVPKFLESNRATFELALGPGEKTSIFLTVACNEGEQALVLDFFRAYRASRRARRTQTRDIATVDSSSELFNEVACRAISDVYMLITSTPFGSYPYAGVPWFSTIFGRDGILTAMFMLWMDPSIARGVLRTLASMQASEVDPSSDAQPGKILHEMRRGEMANLGEVPFGRYYGSVDSTPLFVMLAGMYLDATGDLETVIELWPNVCAALRWMDDYGDGDGDGYVEYQAESNGSLKNQGWKDSHDSIFHEDGTDAVGSIALCEVQGYVFAAKRFAAQMAARLGHHGMATELKEAAEKLRLRFEADFWDEDLGTYVMALDGMKRPCRVRSSNAGHALFSGIASLDHAKRVAATLLSRDGFSGWGIRTLAQGEARYNPMSYHNGSIWPHDNAAIAIGFAQYDLKEEAARVFEGLFDAAKGQEMRRLPELFCGFIRKPGRGPTLYPVACSPQAWAASATFGILGACLGLEQAHSENEIRFRKATMPRFLDEIVLRNVQIGSSSADFRMHRYGNDVATNVLDRRGDAKIHIVK